MIGGVLLPLAVLGFWLNRATERSGESLLRDRLNDALKQIVEQSGVRWVAVRGELLDLADDPAVQQTILAGAKGGSVSVRATAPLLKAHAARSASEQPRITVSARNRRDHWLLTGLADSALRLEAGSDSPIAGERRLRVTIPVYSRTTDSDLGTIHAELPADILIPPGAAGTGGIGAVLGITDRTTGSPLVPLPFDPQLLDRDEFSLGGDRWIVQHRALQEPAVQFAAAAPISTYAASFREAARRGTIALLFVAFGTLALAALLTQRLTRSLEDLASAAESVSRGDLAQRVEAGTTTEIARVASAFNRMTESVKRTLAELAHRERLAAVGEFASSLAHEIRNPLTSIRIDLQRVEERVGANPELKVPLQRALGEISRLDRTVSGALRIARSAAVVPEPIHLSVPLERAIHAATHAFQQAQARLDPVPRSADHVVVLGDSGALEQVFLNLLLNAAQAVDAGGRASVTLEAGSSTVEVIVSDDGRGIPADIRDRIFEPFVTTRQDGTGLGLSVVRQIVTAHHGSITVEQRRERGTIFRVRLPLSTRSAQPPSDARASERNEGAGRT